MQAVSRPPSRLLQLLPAAEFESLHPHLETVELWHVHVEHERIGLKRPRELERLAAVARDVTFERVILKRRLDERGNRRIIVCHNDAASFAHRIAVNRRASGGAGQEA